MLLINKQYHAPQCCWPAFSLSANFCKCYLSIMSQTVHHLATQHTTAACSYDCVWCLNLCFVLLSWHILPSH